MRKERTILALEDILLNDGQDLYWLPKNPRSWTQTDIDRTAASIKEDTDFLEDRPLLVTPNGEGKWIVFAGNLRHEGAKAAGLKQVPCVIYYADSDADCETIKRRAMKDNGSFGSWDFDELANSWDDLPLADWGVPVWENETPAEAFNAVEDDFDETTDEIHVRCKPGDIWELGEHRLMCGDSIDLQQVKTLMGGGES
jgi:site-specific DNA-methyltransferase (adenine-specific)